MADDIHELSALYALDVLEGEERDRYEQHLAGCERCRRELRSLGEAGAALAYTAEGPAPPAELRSRILEQARAEPTNVVPLRPRRSIAVSVAATLAVAATAAAVALGIWSASLHNSLTTERAAVQVLGDPHARHVPVQGASGTLVVTPSGKAALAVELPPPPKGKTYETWVIDNGVHRDRLFNGRPAVLERKLQPGVTVKVTVEPSGGVDSPTTQPILSAQV
jgi:anti-sigma factor RsiW